jgi:hypothetical protein
VYGLIIFRQALHSNDAGANTEFTAISFYSDNEFIDRPDVDLSLAVVVGVDYFEAVGCPLWSTEDLGRRSRGFSFHAFQRGIVNDPLIVRRAIPAFDSAIAHFPALGEIGRASCRERV